MVAGQNSSKLIGSKNFYTSPRTVLWAQKQSSSFLPRALSASKVCRHLYTSSRTILPLGKKVGILRVVLAQISSNLIGSQNKFTSPRTTFVGRKSKVQLFFQERCRRRTSLEHLANILEHLQQASSLLEKKLESSGSS